MTSRAARDTRYYEQQYKEARKQRAQSADPGRRRKRRSTTYQSLNGTAEAFGFKRMKSKKVTVFGHDNPHQKRKHRQ